MDDLLTGRRDKRGHWWPKAPTGTAPIFAWPWRLGTILRWLPGFFLPWNVTFIATGILFWLFLTPPVETMATLAPGWIALILLRNAVTVALFYGAMELWLYVQRRQGTRFKYNPAFPSDKPADAFWWQSQTRDNIARTYLFAIPIWTAWEVGMLWAFANLGWAPVSANWWWLALVMLAVPIWHQVHFFAIHRLIHTPWLYKHVHSVHHNSVNPSPWSSLSMHPVELLLYFSGVLVHLLIGSHPAIALYQMHVAGFGAAVGHVGFHIVETGDDRGVDVHGFTHYLHHKYFEVNYGDGLVPLDKWFGTWHDGSAEGDKMMAARHAARVARANRGRA
jgi:sterol desaturase/sphingolipid hydroxylase (fatty acid hydroxylase superfamily)